MSNSNYSISHLFIYPIKSCRGIEVQSAEITPRGFTYDREYMLVNPEGKFLAQRELPKMAQIEVAIDDEALKVNAPGMEELRIKKSFDPSSRSLSTSLRGKRAQDDKVKKKVKVWDDEFEADVVGEEAGKWFSEFLGRACLLVHLSPNIKRLVEDKYRISEGDEVSFADSYPFHITTGVSLQALNKEMGIELPMNRFRPNIVIPGKFPYAEDHWGEVTIGKIPFVLTKPCVRCAITTTDQETGKVGEEPLKTLTRIRKYEKGVAFGQKAICCQTSGMIHVGDPVEIVKQK